jgi:hypothetical protein
LEIKGTIASIESGLFMSFNKLEIVYFNLPSLVNFFHRVDLEWTKHFDRLRVGVIFNEINSGLPKWLNPGGVYTYPDRDLCLFVKIPLNSVVPLLKSNLTVCTKTIAWQNYQLSLMKKLFPPNVLETFNACRHNNTLDLYDINRQIKHCSVVSSNKQIGDDYKAYIDFYDIINAFEFVNDLLEFFIIPFACILGLLLNLRVVYTVHKNSKVELKENFYKYMMINSVFNSIFSTIYAFYPINYCQQYEKGYFCSTIYNTVPAQVLKIVFIGYFGEVLKMCSNISYICITTNRYMLIGKSHNNMIEWVSQLNLKLVVVLTVAFSVLMNIGHAFQYRINWGWSNEIFEHKLVSYLYPSIVIFNSAFQVYAVVYFFINCILFLAVNTGIEFCLLRNLRKEIGDKRTKLEKEIQESESKNASGSQLINKVIKAKQKKIEQDSKKERRATVMVIINSGLNFVLRFPEIFIFVSSNSNLIVAFTTTLIFYENTFFSNLSSIMVNLSYLFYILTFTTNAIIYCVFNPNFKKHYILWEYNVKSK